MDEFIRTRLLPESEARKVLKPSGAGQAYGDPQLRERNTYARFVEG